MRVDETLSKLSLGCDPTGYSEKPCCLSVGTFGDFKQLLPCLFFTRDAADKVVREGGKFEELVVASNEVAASTAQLVSAWIY